MVTAELREVAVLLAASGGVALVAHRFRISALLAFLLVGVLVGPHVLGRLAGLWPPLEWLVIRDETSIHLAAELGVAFLLFMIGLELSLDRLWRMRALVFRLGGAQVLVSAALIGAVAAWFGNAVPVAVVLGAALALSSTAIVMQLLAERGRMGSPLGRVAFGILLLQDLAVVPILFLVGVLGGDAEGGHVALGVALALGKAALAIAVILLVGRWLLRPGLRAIASTHSREAFLSAILLVILATAAATELAGLSLALGAFLAGILLGETEFRPQIAVDLEPFKGLLLGVFFVSVGLGLDLPALLSEPVLILGSAFGLILLKGVVIYALVRLMGEGQAVAIEAALLLGQAGEFAFIVLALATTLGLLPAPIAAFFALVVGVTMIVTPGLAAIGRKLAARFELAAPAPAQAQVDHEIEGHVIIAGYGRVGRAVGEMLDGQRIAHVAADMAPARVAALRAQGAAAFFGDASRREFLEHLGAGRAAALVVTMDQPEVVLAVVKAARAHWPHLPIHARVRDEEHARALLAAGATRVVLEVTEASLQLGEALLTTLGVPDDAARALVDEQRTRARLAVGTA
jgi:monovalent cation:proton antiporter-2 (CPA2) family protein